MTPRSLSKTFSAIHGATGKQASFSLSANSLLWHFITGDRRRDAFPQKNLLVFQNTGMGNIPLPQRLSGHEIIDKPEGAAAARAQRGIDHVRINDGLDRTHAANLTTFAAVEGRRFQNFVAMSGVTTAR